MAKKFQTLREKMSPERQARIRARTEELLAAMPLNQVRKARALSQEELAEALDLNQSTVSKLERRADMYISTMRRFVRAMGGELEIRARFPEGVFEIDQFGALPSPSDPAQGEGASGPEKRATRRKTTKRRPRRQSAS